MPRSHAPDSRPMRCELQAVVPATVVVPLAEALFAQVIIAFNLTPILTLALANLTLTLKSQP